MENVLVIKGHFMFTPTPETFAVYENSCLVCVDGKVEGIYPTLPDRFKGETVHDYGNRLEKFIHTGDDRNICARYVEGEKL